MGAAEPWEVYFSPEGGATEAIVREVRRARKTIHVQAFSFTSLPIARALADASVRQVSVVVVLDKSILQEPHAAVETLARAGISRLIDSEHSIAHNKVMVIDGETVITGSFNFTSAAEHHNAENLLILRDRDLARKYEENWNLHRSHSASDTSSADSPSKTRLGRRSPAR